MLNHTSLYEALVCDIAAHGTLKPDVITGLVRWFHVDHQEYVSRVTEWQKFLVAGTADVLSVGPLLVRAGVAQVWGPGYALLPDARRISDVHQIAMLFWKEIVPMAPDWDGYAERMSRGCTADFSDPMMWKLRERIHYVLGKAPSWEEMIGTASSGATADRRNALTRWSFDRPPLGVPESFYRYNRHDLTSMLADIVPTARAACVSKNRKSPRYVASEPCACMFAQKAIMRAMERRLQCCYGNKVPIRDADSHRRFLQRHSSNAVTIDLSDASDHIRMDLAEFLLPSDWFALCNACRSQLVILPDGRHILLTTYAPMGNGFCFRLLSLVCASILDVCCTGPWSDFGDDMICLNRDAPQVLRLLNLCGLVVNFDKTCTDYYKETCGLELFGRYDITPLKLKKVIQFRSGRMADGMAARRAADLCLYHVAGVLCEGLCNIKARYNRCLQRLERRYPVWITFADNALGDDWPEFWRWYITRGDNFKPDYPTDARTKVGFRWLAPYEYESYTLSDQPLLAAADRENDFSGAEAP